MEGGSIEPISKLTFDWRIQRKRNSAFSQKLIVHNFRDGIRGKHLSTLDASTRKLTDKDTSIHRKKMKLEFGNLSSRLQSELSYIESIAVNISDAQRIMTQQALRIFSVILLQKMYRMHRAKHTLKILKGRRFLSEWLFFRRYYKNILKQKIFKRKVAASMIISKVYNYCFRKKQRKKLMQKSIVLGFVSYVVYTGVCRASVRKQFIKRNTELFFMNNEVSRPERAYSSPSLNERPFSPQNYRPSTVQTNRQQSEDWKARLKDIQEETIRNQRQRVNSDENPSSLSLILSQFDSSRPVDLSQLQDQAFTERLRARTFSDIDDLKNSLIEGHSLPVPNENLVKEVRPSTSDVGIECNLLHSFHEHFLRDSNHQPILTSQGLNKLPARTPNSRTNTGHNSSGNTVNNGKKPVTGSPTTLARKHLPSVDRKQDKPSKTNKSTRLKDSPVVEPKPPSRHKQQPDKPPSAPRLPSRPSGSASSKRSGRLSATGSRGGRGRVLRSPPPPKNDLEVPSIDSSSFYTMPFTEMDSSFIFGGSTVEASVSVLTDAFPDSSVLETEDFLISKGAVSTFPLVSDILQHPNLSIDSNMITFETLKGCQSQDDVIEQESISTIITTNQTLPVMEDVKLGHSVSSTLLLESTSIVAPTAPAPDNKGNRSRPHSRGRVVVEQQYLQHQNSIS